MVIVSGGTAIGDDGEISQWSDIHAKFGKKSTIPRLWLPQLIPHSFVTKACDVEKYNSSQHACLCIHRMSPPRCKTIIFL